jgi:hypothetical protein
MESYLNFKRLMKIYDKEGKNRFFKVYVQVHNMGRYLYVPQRAFLQYQ